MQCMSCKSESERVYSVAVRCTRKANENIIQHSACSGYPQRCTLCVLGAINRSLVGVSLAGTLNKHQKRVSVAFFSASVYYSLKFQLCIVIVNENQARNRYRATTYGRKVRCPNNSVLMLHN